MAAEPPKSTPPIEPLELIDLGPEDSPLPEFQAQGRLELDASAAAQPPPSGFIAPEEEASALEALLGLGPRPGSAVASRPDVSTTFSAMPTLELDDTPPAPRLTNARPTQSRANAPNALVMADDPQPMMDGDTFEMAEEVSPADVVQNQADLGFSERTPESINTAALQAASRLPEEEAKAAQVVVPTAAGAATSKSVAVAQTSASSGPSSEARYVHHKQRSWLIPAGLAVAILGGAGTWYWRSHNATTDAAQTAAEIAIAASATSAKRAPMPRVEPPKKARPHLSLVPVAPLPAPKADALTTKNVDTLDYASLQTGSQALSQTKDAALYGVHLWSLFRLAAAFDDAVAQASLAHALQKTSGRLSPLGQLAQVGHKVLSSRPEASLVALHGLKGAAAKLPQAHWLNLWASGRAKGSGFAPLPTQLHALEHLGAGAQAQPDAQVLLAQWWLHADAKHAGTVADWAQAAQKRGDAGTQARLLAVLIEAEAWQVLDTALGAPEADDQAATRAALVQASPAHQDLLWRLRVHRHVRMGNFTAAMRLAEQRAQAEPKHAEAQAEWQRLADYLTPDARPAVAANDNNKTSDPAADMMQASRQLFEAIAQGNHDAAASPISKMLALSASLPTPWAQLAEAERQGNWKDAAHTLDGLLWRDPTIGDPVDDMLQLIELTHRGGDSARASIEAQALVKSLPHDDRPPLLLAQMAHEEHHADDQVHWLNTILERHPHARAHTLALAMALTDANRAPEALTALSTLATLDPEARDAEFLYVQGRAMGRTNPVAARTVLLASAKMKPQVKTYVLLSETEQARGQLDDAGDAMRKAMSLAPEQWDLKVKLARLLVPRKGYKEAAEVLQQVLRDEPKATEAAELLGDVLHEQGELARAAETYAQACKAKDAPAPLLLKLALLQMHELKDLPAAEKTLRRAVATDPSLPEPYYYLGLALHDRNADAEAKKELQTYLRMSPDGAFVSDAKEAMQGL